MAALPYTFTWKVYCVICRGLLWKPGNQVFPVSFGSGLILVFILKRNPCESAIDHLVYVVLVVPLDVDVT